MHCSHLLCFHPLCNHNQGLPKCISHRESLHDQCTVSHFLRLSDDCHWLCLVVGNGAGKCGGNMVVYQGHQVITASNVLKLHHICKHMYDVITIHYNNEITMLLTSFVNHTSTAYTGWYDP